MMTYTKNYNQMDSNELQATIGGSPWAMAGFIVSAAEFGYHLTYESGRAIYRLTH